MFQILTQTAQTLEIISKASTDSPPLPQKLWGSLIVRSLQIVWKWSRRRPPEMSPNKDLFNENFCFCIITDAVSGYELKAPSNYTVFTEGLEVEFSIPTGISLPNGRLEIIYSAGATGKVFVSTGISLPNGRLEIIYSAGTKGMISGVPQ